MVKILESHNSMALVQQPIHSHLSLWRDNVRAVGPVCVRL